MLTVDARLCDNPSGLGTYVRQVVPGILRSFERLPIGLLGNPIALKALGWLDRANVRAIAFSAPMYSVREQWQANRVIPAQTRLFFSPHYNIPIACRHKLIVTVHDLCHLVLPSGEGRLAKAAYAAFMFRAIRKRADAVLTNSTFTRHEFMRLMPRSSQPVTPIHLGVSDLWFQAQSLREKNSGRPYVIYVGNVKPHKNLRRLIAAFEMMVETIPHSLVVAGRRDQVLTPETDLAPVAARLGDRIRFTGYVDDASLRHWVANADLLVLPSLYEGFGLPPLEAMAAGCPAAVADIPALRETCGNAAAYFDPRSPEDIAFQMIDVLRKDSLRDRLRERGLGRAREFSWKRCVDATCAVLADLLGESHRPAALESGAIAQLSGAA